MIVANENNRGGDEPKKPFKPVVIMLETEREYYELSAALLCVDYKEMDVYLKRNNKLYEYVITKTLRGMCATDKIVSELFDMRAPFINANNQNEESML